MMTHIGKDPLRVVSRKKSVLVACTHAPSYAHAF